MDWSGSPEPASQLARWPQYHRSRFPPVITACVAKRGGQTPGIGAVPARATVHRVRHHCAHDPCDWTRAYFLGFVRSTLPPVSVCSRTARFLTWLTQVLS